MFESELRRSAQLTPAFLPSVPNTSIIEGERQVHLWAKCLSQKLSQEAKPPGTKPSTSLRGTEKPFAQTKSVRLKTVRYTCDSLACGRQHRLEQEEAVFPCTRGLTWCACPAVLEADVSLLLRPDTRAGDPPLRSVHVPGPLALTPTHTLTLTRGVTRGSDGAKNNPSCRHKRAGEHTAVCCRKSVCVCVCGRTAAVTALSLSLLSHFPSGIVSDMTGVRGCESVSFSGVLPALAVSLSSLSFFSFHFLLGKLHAPVVSSPAPLSLSPQSLVNIKEMLVRPLPLSPSLSLSRFFLVYTPSSPLPSLFFLTVKAAFQMLISTQSKRERGRVELWLAFG